MATTFQTEIPDICFTCDIPDIVIQTDTDSVVVSIYDDRHNLVYETTLFAFNGFIVFRDVRTILENYMQTYNLSYHEFELLNGSGEILYFKVVFCLFKSSIPCANFVNSSFLSTLSSKLTTPDTLEYLHFFHNSNDTIDISVIGYIKDDEQDTVSTTLLEETRSYTNRGIDSFTIKPSLLTTDNIIAYNVVIGNKIFAFYLTKQLPTVTFVFRNLFGLFETLNLWGTTKEVMTVNRTIGVIHGKYTSYDNSSELEYSFTSAPMDITKLHWLKQFISSFEVIMNNLPVLITNPKYEVSDADDTENSISFNYRYKETLPIQIMADADRTFSEQFNSKFS